jgi:ribose-phosphate pyrophosphokinase
MIKVINSQDNLATITTHTFAGGEEHVNISDFSVDINSVITIACIIDSSSELIKLLLITDSLRRLYPENDIELYMPYVPYARQDRVCGKGDAFSLEVFAKLINSENYNEVVVVDPHSSITKKLIKNLRIIPQWFMLYRMYNPVYGSALNSLGDKVDISYIVSPDKGARDKTNLWLECWNNTSRPKVELITANKVRNTQTGNITSTQVDCENLEGKNCLIVDDICDGGRTFVELAKVLKAKGAGYIDLYVTHGIFSQGLPLEGIRNVYTTDSFGEKADGRIIVRRFF